MNQEANLGSHKNGGDKLTQKLAIIGQKLVSFKAIFCYHAFALACLIFLGYYYQNDFSYVILGGALSWVGGCEIVRQIKGRRFREIYKYAVPLPFLLSSLSNLVLMRFSNDRLTVIEGFNDSVNALTRELQPAFFVPGLYKVTDYQVNQSLRSKCPGQLQTNDEQPFFGVVEIPLQLVRETIIQTHQVVGNEQNLKQMIEKIVCAQAANIVKSFPDSLLFGSGIRFRSKKAYETMFLDKALSVLGVQRGETDYLSIRNMTFLDI